MKKYDVAAFIWPAYTGDEPRTRIFWPDGIGEWQSVMAMKRNDYAGSRWPRRPLWGYENEADSLVMEKQIDCAVSHGVNVFIYDWYWFDNRPFLENCLNDGFLKARNCESMKFYLMWANHNATHLWDKRNSDDLKTVIWSGVITPEQFDFISDRTIERYFKRDNYYLIDGCPAYMIFDPHNFIRCFGTTQACRRAIDSFRAKVKSAGFPDLHLQFVHWAKQNYDWLPDGDPMKGKSKQEVYDYLGVDSVTDYNWGGAINLDGDYARLTGEYSGHLARYYAENTTPYYPNLTLGWDNNVRFNRFIPGVVTGNTPEKIERAAQALREITDEKLASGVLRAPLVTLNSWNEWTEGSYLEPDDLYGYGYLEAVRKVFTYLI